MVRNFSHRALLVLLTMGAATTPANATSSGGGLRRIRFGHHSLHTSMIDESKATSETFGRMYDISETDALFRRLDSGSMSMTSKSSSDDEANVRHDDNASIPEPWTATATSSSTHPAVEEENAVWDPSMAPESSPPMLTMTPSFAPTPTCNLSDDERHNALLEELGVLSMSDLTDSSTPQGKAFNWIVHLDDIHLCPGDDRLIQRYAAVVLYFSTGGKNWNDNTSWLSAESECKWAGLACNLIGELTSVKLDNNNLEGAVPMELGALLIAKSIELHNNNVQGFMPTSICDNILPLGELGVLTSDCDDGNNNEPSMVGCNCCTRCY